jgi:hypothetical protein
MQFGEGCFRVAASFLVPSDCEVREDAGPMTATRLIRRSIALAGILLAALCLPACSSWRDGSGYPLLTNRNPNREYVVQRPTYGPDTGKPFFVGGYAGANYGPIFPRRAMQYEEGVGVPVADQPTVSVEHGAWDPE